LKRAFRWALISLAALTVVSLGANWAQQQLRHADASPQAIAAMRSDASVLVEQGRYLVLRPRQTPERMGVVFYPGAYADIRGYVPTLRPIAAAGYRIVIVPMPFELAIFGFNAARDVQRVNPDLANWAIVGHSVGGAMAAMFASRNPDAVQGVIIWDSYPPSMASLTDYPKPAWLIHRATPDGAPPASFARNRKLYPPESPWVPIPGAIHMNFGSFQGGGYVEDWQPGITQAQQHEQVIAATLQALRQIEQEASRGNAKP